MFVDSPYMDLQAWYRLRLSAGSNPVGGSRELAARFAPIQGHQTQRTHSTHGGTGGRDHSEEDAA